MDLWPQPGGGGEVGDQLRREQALEPDHRAGRAAGPVDGALFGDDVNDHRAGRGPTAGRAVGVSALAAEAVRAGGHCPDYPDRIVTAHSAYSSLFNPKVYADDRTWSAQRPIL